jgi:hypothetical protein
MSSTTLDLDAMGAPAASATAAPIAEFIHRATTSARRFFADMRRDEPQLFHLGWALQLAIAPLAVIADAYARMPGHMAIDPWVKPMKFAASLAVLAWTVAPLLQSMHLTDRWRRRARLAVTGGALAELAFVSAQAARATFHDGPATKVDRAILQGASTAILVVCAVLIAIAALSFDDRRVAIADRVMVGAVRAGLVVFIGGSAIGGYILERGAHTVGASNPAATMPMTNWNMSGGDLRIAHFMAIHAIQVLPALAWLLHQVRPSLTIARRSAIVRVATVALTVAIVGTFAQAMLGRPLV